MIAFLKDKKNKLILLAFASVWFYIIPTLYQFIFLNNDNPQKVIAQIESDITKQENAFTALSNQEALLNALAKNTFNKEDIDKCNKEEFSFQLYKVYNDTTYQLHFWNNNTVIPSTEDLIYPDGKYAITKENGQYEFIKKTIHIKNELYWLTAFLPIRFSYFIETDYLKKQFTASSSIEKKYTLSTDPTIYSIKNKEGVILLYIKKVTDVRNTSYSWIYIFCRLCFLILIIWLLWELSLILIKKKNSKIGFLVFFASILLLRACTFYFSFPLDYSSIEYFDPRIYALNNLFKSLGDITFNLIIIFVLLIFWIKNYQEKQFEKVKFYFLFQYLKLLIFVVGTFYTVWIFRSLISSSKISYNVTNFFSLNIYSVFGFLHIAALILLYYLLTIKVLRIQNIYIKNSAIKYFVIAAFGLLILYLNVPWANDKICMFILLWALVYALISSYLLKKNSPTLIRLNIILLVFFTISASILFNYEVKKRELTDRIILAKKIGFQSDQSTENLLSIALTRFDNRFLSKNINKFYNPSSSLKYKDSLLSENFVGYLNKFETKIYTYDTLEKPLFNADSSSYQTFNAIVTNQGKRIANIVDLFYYEIGFDLFRYVFKKNILDSTGHTIGYFVIQANPLTYKNKSSALSPELFKQRNIGIDENGGNYIFAVYNHLELRKRFIDFDLPTTISNSDIPIGEDTIKHRNGYEELWLKINKDSLVVVGKKESLWIETITLFAYLFFSMVFLAFFINFLNILFTGKFNIVNIKNIMQLNFSKQVQAIIWSVSLFTFVIVGIVIISLFKTRFTKSNKERLSRTMGILVADVQNKFNNNAIFDDVVKVYEPGVNEALKQTIFQMSEIHNVDFNIYDLDGTLKLSSQPFIESKGIISNKMDRNALYFLNKKASAQFMQEEKIGSFSYLSMYVPIRDESGKAYGYLNIPYYSSQIDLNQEISNFLVTIINLNAFIFLIAGLVAWLVTNRITNSFAIIGNKMKEVGFGKNEIIKWNKNDEIGGLVTEYNKMVVKLEESATSLAKSEREGAWREMARQVAHEIKNPLTPMKLSIQYLQKSIENGNDNIKDLTTKVSQTLVEQIDHLSSIASDFSQFANIGNSKIEEIDLVPVLQSLQLLFSNENDVVISVHIEANQTKILADKTQINRLFTNLIKNGIQAYEYDIIKTIDINVKNIDDKILITCTDYGNGIADALQEKIFTPNFTTKSSGTGLGLAISKGIVEQASGTISFKTALNIGTSFYVKFPITI